jgi:DNA recombination protein RmuC
MDGLTLALAVIAAAALALAAAAVFRGRGGSAADLSLALAESEQRAAEAAHRMSTSQAELAGRLTQLAEAHASAQARLAELMQNQEREVAKRLDERLADVTKKVGDSLEKSSTQAQTTLTDLKERLAVIDRAQKTITDLSTQVVSLQDILSNKQARGAFGEIQLADLVRAALPPSAYAFQAPIGDGRRADCLLTLPNPPGPIAIDAKFPLESYYQLRQADNDVAREQARRALGQAVLVHVKNIAQRYIVPGKTAESALMFLPSEAVYAELHANLPQVVAQSWREKVWIVSPTTLMATLNTVRAVLKDASMREQAHVIQKEVHTLLDDVTRLDDRVGRLQKHFGQADEDLRQIRISTEKITKRAERIEAIEMGDEGVEEALAPPVERLEATGG